MEPTNLMPFREFTDRLEAEWRRAVKSSLVMSFVLFEIDGLDEIGRQFGTATKSQIIDSVTNKIPSCVRREADLFTRRAHSGFLIALPETPIEGTTKVAESLRTAINQLPIKSEKDIPIHLTASLVYGSISPGESHNVDVVLARLEKGMMDVTRKGTNLLEAVALA